jgi:class I fructose-bisphosphate aldolase
MELGTKKRLTHIFDPASGRTVLVPMDHGMAMPAPKGIWDIRKAVDDMHEGGASAVIMHKGLIRASGLENANTDMGLVMHLTASTEFSPASSTKVLTGTVEEAIRLGADAVSLQVNLGDANERIMLENAGKIADHCNRWGMPLLMMLYGRGGLIRDNVAVEVVAQCARVGAELGADIVMVSYTGSPGTFERVTAGCCCPVVIAGGERMDSTRRLLEMAWGSLQAGSAGVSIGRNVFDHPRRVALMKALHAMVHHGATVQEGMDIVGED